MGTPPSAGPAGLGRAASQTLLRGRGARHNPTNRFQTLHYEPEPAGAIWSVPEGAAPHTEFLSDPSRSVVARNESPDIGFEASLNPYRGCEHGCVYCYARPTHEYLGFSAGLDFETKILVKPDAPALLRRALASPSWKPQLLAFSGVTDPYQPVERRLRVTRRCLEVLLEFRNPVSVITKSRLVARDADLLSRLAEFECAAVTVSITTLDTGLQRVLEPRAPHPGLRLDGIGRLASAGVPVGVMVGPVLPGLTEHELPRILAAAAGAGARFAGYTVLRLPHAVKEIFSDWLSEHFPDRREKVLGRIRELRGGRLNDPRFGTRQRGGGPFAEQIKRLFELGCRRAGIAEHGPELSTQHFRRPDCLFSDAEMGSTLPGRAGRRT